MLGSYGSFSENTRHIFSLISKAANSIFIPHRAKYRAKDTIGMEMRFAPIHRKRKLQDSALASRGVKHGGNLVDLVCMMFSIQLVPELYTGLQKLMVLQGRWKVDNIITYELA